MPGNQPDLKEALYELVDLERPFGPIEEAISDALIKKYAFAMDDYHPWYFGDSPFGRRIAPPGLLVNDLLWLFGTAYNPHTSVGLHTQEELWFSAPAFAGERVTLTGKHIEKYERRGKGHVVMEANAHGEDGRLLLRHRDVTIFRVPATPVSDTPADRSPVETPEKRVTGEYNKEVEPVSRARRGIAPGTPLVSLPKRAAQEQVTVFSGFVELLQISGRARGIERTQLRNIHTTPEVAQSAGLRDTVLQGVMENNFLTELLTNFFGAAWLTSGWQKVKFIKPVYSGEPTTAGGVVTCEKETDGGIRLELEIWLRNAAGQLAATGWAGAALE